MRSPNSGRLDNLADPLMGGAFWYFLIPAGGGPISPLLHMLARSVVESWLMFQVRNSPEKNLDAQHPFRTEVDEVVAGEELLTPLNDNQCSVI